MQQTSIRSFETAVEHACRAVPICGPTDRAGDVLARMAGKGYDCATHVVVRDGETFVGLIRIEKLLAAPGGAVARELVEADAPVVAPGVDQEIAAWLAVGGGQSALAVVDDDGQFLGLIPPDRLLAVLLSEHEEDLSRLGGFLRGASEARESTKEPVRRRFRHRVPWLLLGLAGALIAADVVGRFELQLRETITLAFFLPGIVYLADAVGTQTETIVVRGLSVGVPVRSVLGRESLSGVVIGFALAVIAGPVVWLRWGDPAVALAVALSIAAAASVATLVAMILPWLFDRLGQDPAFGSGPLATVIQDILSIAIYFAIALAVVS